MVELSKHFLEDDYYPHFYSAFCRDLSQSNMTRKTKDIWIGKGEKSSITHTSYDSLHRKSKRIYSLLELIWAPQDYQRQKQ